MSYFAAVASASFTELPASLAMCSSDLHEARGTVEHVTARLSEQRVLTLRPGKRVTDRRADSEGHGAEG